MIHFKLKLYLLKEIPQIIYSLYQAKESTKKRFNNVWLQYIHIYIYIYIYIYNAKRIYICEFKKCKISDPHMLVLPLADKIDLKILY